MSLFYTSLFKIFSLFSHMQSFRITPTRFLRSFQCIHHSLLSSQHTTAFLGPLPLDSLFPSHITWHSFIDDRWKHFYISWVCRVNHSITSWAYEWLYTPSDPSSQTPPTGDPWDMFPSRPVNTT